MNERRIRYSGASGLVAPHGGLENEPVYGGRPFHAFLIKEHISFISNDNVSENPYNDSHGLRRCATREPLSEAHMKSLVKIAFIAALVAPVLSYAAEPLTHAQVRAELIQLEEAGYNPIDENDYPHNLKPAQAIVAQQKEANAAYGSDTAGASQSGRIAQAGEK